MQSFWRLIGFGVVKCKEFWRAVERWWNANFCRKPAPVGEDAVLFTAPIELTFNGLHTKDLVEKVLEAYFRDFYYTRFGIRTDGYQYFPSEEAVFSDGQVVTVVTFNFMVHGEPEIGIEDIDWVLRYPDLVYGFVATILHQIQQDFSSSFPNPFRFYLKVGSEGVVAPSYWNHLQLPNISQLDPEVSEV